MMRTSALVLALLVATPAAAQSGPGWDSRFRLPGPGEVDHVVLAGSRVIVSGPGGMEEWDEERQSWNAVPGFVEQVIHDLKAIGDSLVLVAGAFERSDGTRNLAVWNLNSGTWTSPDSVAGPVTAMSNADGGRVVVGIRTESRWAEWRLASWSPTNHTLRSLPVQHSGNLTDLLLRDHLVFAARRFSDYTEVMRWDGSRREVIAHSNSTVVSLSLMPDGELLVGGCLRDLWVPLGGYGGGAVGMTRVHNTAAWRDGVWRALGQAGGEDECVSRLRVEDGVLLASLEPRTKDLLDRYGVTNSLSTPDPLPSSRIVARIDGSWSELMPGLTGSIRDFAADEGRIVVGGTIEAAGDRPAHGVASYSLSRGSWQPLSDPSKHGINGLPSVLHGAADGSLYAAGPFHSAGGLRVNGIARWNGTEWEALGGGLGWDGDLEIFDVASTSARVYVSGTFNRVGDVESGGLALWETDAERWVTLNGAPPGVRVIAAGESVLYVAGDLEIHRHNGSSWQLLAVTDAQVNDMWLDPDGSLLVAGDFTSLEEFDETGAGREVPAQGVASLRHGGWSAHGAGIPAAQFIRTHGRPRIQHDRPLPHAPPLPNILVAGSRKYPLNRANLAYWGPDERWDLVDGGFDLPSFQCRARTTGLVEWNGAVYLSGIPEECPPRVWRPAGLLRRWDESEWRDVDPGLEAVGVTSMAVAFSQLFIAGDFNGHVAAFSAGDPVSGEWDDSPSGIILDVYPNPLRKGTGNIHLVLPQAGETTITLLDMLGRPVSKIVEEALPAGPHSFRWSGPDIAAGVYILRVQSSGRTTTAAVVYTGG